MKVFSREAVARHYDQLDPRSEYRRFLLDRREEERVFAVTMLRIWLAHRVGALRYGMLTARRPLDDES